MDFEGLTLYLLDALENQPNNRKEIIYLINNAILIGELILLFVMQLHYYGFFGIQVGNCFTNRQILMKWLSIIMRKMLK